MLQTKGFYMYLISALETVRGLGNILQMLDLVY